MMNGCEIRLAFEGDADEAVDVAVGNLIKVGYALETRHRRKVHLKRHGSWFTSNPENHSHHLYVEPSGGELVFDFTTGIVASYWTEKDEAWARARAEQAMAGVARPGAGGEGPFRAAGAGPEPMAACRYCGKINLLTLPACTSCGSGRYHDRR